MRGKKIYQTLFGEQEVLDVVQDESDRRGRDPELIRQRNKHILYRFEWYGRKNLRFDWILKRIGSEFYLSPSTMGQLIEDSVTELKAIKKENLSDRQLAARFPWW